MPLGLRVGIDRPSLLTFKRSHELCGRRFAPVCSRSLSVGCVRFSPPPPSPTLENLLRGPCAVRIELTKAPARADHALVGDHLNSWVCRCAPDENARLLNIWF